MDPELVPEETIKPEVPEGAGLGVSLELLGGVAGAVLAVTATTALVVLLARHCRCCRCCILLCKSCQGCNCPCRYDMNLCT